jgi:dihydroorotase
MESNGVVVLGATVLDSSGDQLTGYHLILPDGEHAQLTDDESAASGLKEVDGGRYVITPGLVDAHTHVFEGVTFMGMPAAEMSLPTGVTAVIDAGSAGIDTFDAFLRWIVEPADVSVYAFVNLSRVGLTGTQSVGELENRRHIDDDGLRDVLQRTPQVARGIKVRVAKKAAGSAALDLIERAKAIAHPLGLPVLVHAADSEESAEDVLNLLDAGDVLTHYQSARTTGLLDADGRILGEAWDARERGVLFDCGHGGSHFSFDVAEELAAQGFWPDLLGTDISKVSFAELKPGLAAVISKWLAIGMPLPDAVRASCETPYRTLIGTEPPGFCDLAVFELSDHATDLADCAGVTRAASTTLVPQLTVRGGRIAWTRAAASTN